MKKIKAPSKKMKNRKFSKKSVKKMPLESLNTLFIFMFSFCESWKRQNTKVLFFRPIGLLKKFFVDDLFFLLFFFLYFSISTNLKVKKNFCTFLSQKCFVDFKKILYTFLSTFRNIKVKKNPRKNSFQIVPLEPLNALFSTLKTGKLRFSSLFDGRLNYFVI